MNVFDASALLTFVQGEPGAEVVEEALVDDGLCGAANWSEVAQKVLAHGRNWELTRALLASHDVLVEPVTAQDAEWAAARWVPHEGLSLADRLCMALGARSDGPVWTADSVWGSDGRIRQIREP